MKGEESGAKEEEKSESEEEKSESEEESEVDIDGKHAAKGKTIAEGDNGDGKDVGDEKGSEGKDVTRENITAKYVGDGNDGD